MMEMLNDVYSSNSRLDSRAVLCDCGRQARLQDPSLSDGAKQRDDTRGDILCTGWGGQVSAHTMFTTARGHQL